MMSALVKASSSSGDCVYVMWYNDFDKTENENWIMHCYRYQVPATVSETSEWELTLLLPGIIL